MIKLRGNNNIKSISCVLTIIVYSLSFFLYSSIKRKDNHSPNYVFSQLTFWPWDIYQAKPKKENIYGFRFGVPCSYSKQYDTLYGLDLGLLLNVSNNVNGIQVAPIANWSENSNGLQVGLINNSTESNILQIGFLNNAFDKTHCIQIGLINWLSNGFLPIFPIINFSI